MAVILLKPDIIPPVIDIDIIKILTDLISKIGIILFERIDWVSKSIFNIKNKHATPVPIKELKKCAKKLSSIIRLKTNGTIIIDHQGNISLK